MKIVKLLFISILALTLAGCTQPDSSTQNNISNTVHNTYTSYYNSEKPGTKCTESLVKNANGSVYVEHYDVYMEDAGNLSPSASVDTTFLADSAGNKISDMPMINVKSFGGITDFTDLTITDNYNTDGSYILQRNNLAEKPYCIIYPDASTIRFSSYSAFFRNEDAQTDLEFISRGNFMAYADGRSVSIHGCDVEMILSHYDIPLIYEKGEVYIPVATFSDLFLSPSRVSLTFNGHAFYYGQLTSQTNLLKDFYTKSTFRGKNRSDRLVNFNYNELLLALDYLYGLKEEHSITTFEDYFKRTGLKDLLLNKGDPKDSSKAIEQLVYLYFDDLHSSFYIGNTFTSYEQTVTVKGKANRTLREKLSELQALRMSVNGWDKNSYKANNYQEQGDTAFISFDNFSSYTYSKQYYSENLANALNGIDTSEFIDSTYGLIIYAHAMITRSGSPIKRVVIDLTTNTGGATNALAYIQGWLLDEADIAVYNPVTKASAITSYISDINLDGYANNEDRLRLNSDNPIKKIYILTSPVSFSCGNALPVYAKDSRKATLIGERTGGGSCIVQPAVTADGTVYQFSSHSRISTYRNGSYYDSDKGVDPDYYMTSYDLMYDRSEFVKYLDTLK